VTTVLAAPGYRWCVSVGGDHCFTNSYANAAGAAPRFAPRRTAEGPSARAGASRATPADKDALPESAVVRDAQGRPAATAGEPLTVRSPEAIREPLVVRDSDLSRERVVTAAPRALREIAPGTATVPEPAAVPKARESDQQAGPDAGFRGYGTARSRALLRTAYLLTGNAADAEDLLQAALAKTFLAWDRIEDRGALDGYVRRAMVNTHISWWRRRRVEEYPTDEIPDQAVADPAVSSDLQETLRRAVDRLPDRMRAAVVLRYYEDMTEAEVADVLGVSLGTVKSTVSRAVAKLRTDADLQSD
jgi:RNA polymerase sigma-70 factor (sigma-E family)